MDRFKRFLHSDLGRAVLLILALKLLIFVIADVAYILSIAETAPLRPVQMLGIWYQWDALHYVSIAEHGYTALPGQPVLINFMPMYPLMIRAALAFGLSAFSAAMIVANVSSLCGLVAFYKLALLEFGEEEARTSLIALAIFPTAYFFNAPYTEGPFLLFSVGSFLAAKKNRWTIAGILGGLAALTRYMGVFLFPALLVDYWLRRAEMRNKFSRAVSLLLIPLIFSIYLLINHRVYGNPFAFLRLQHSVWQRDLAWPWVGMMRILEAYNLYAANNQGLTTGAFEFFAAMLFVVGTVFAFKSLRLPYGIFVLGAALISISNTYLIGTPRYLLSAFPLFLLVRRVGRFPNLMVGLFLLSSALLALCTGLYVRGWWAF